LFAKVLPLKEAEQRFEGIREPFLDILLLLELARGEPALEGVLGFREAGA
jgi:hypothetical protein